MSKSSNTIEDQMREVVESIETIGIVERLTIEQKAALEQKFLALPAEVRDKVANLYPGLDNIGRYVMRQIVKEANGKLASNLRPGWYSRLSENAKALLSDSEELRKYGTKMLTELADDFDSKEAVSLIKKYKNQTDRTTKDKHIVQICDIFGLKAESIK